jgi:hypothetical protein
MSIEGGFMSRKSYDKFAVAAEREMGDIPSGISRITNIQHRGRCIF